MVRFLVPSLVIVATISGESDRHRRLLGIREKQKDKMRSCLDAEGKKVILDDKLSACNYVTYKDGSFEQICQNMFKNGDDSVCPEKSDDGLPIVRDNTSEDVVSFWKESSVDISLVPDYELTLTPLGKSGTCKCGEKFRTKPLPGNCGFPEYDEPGASSGRLGCSDPKCNATVCDQDSFCCGDFNGFWDRICVGYAGTLCDDYGG